MRAVSPTRAEAELLEQVARRLREELDRQHITHDTLARQLGVSKGEVSEILSGRRNLTLRTLVRVARALGHEVRLRLVQYE